ncbi:MAG: hypothetical protein F6K55_25980 [Moorea sp. SIO4A3]|nr:hypothetical protein [Moorena sp. SIO4A3]
MNFWWAVPSNGIGYHMNLSGALPTRHQLIASKNRWISFLIFSILYSLFYIP